jgi:radical SAM superfamily enzyme YgiQ (UPF0313 family)
MDRRIAMFTPHALSHRTAEETLALGYLGKMLRNRGWDTMIVDAWLENLNQSQTVEKVCRNGAPSVLCFSCYRSNLKEAEELLTLFRCRIGNVPAICGGYGPTFHDEDFLNAGFTVAVRGEAEHTIADLAESVCFGNNLNGISGISFKKDGVLVRTKNTVPEQNLNALPFPLRDTVELSVQRKNPVHVCTSRGCMAHCTFCSVVAFGKINPGMAWRSRSAENIIDELKAIVDTYGIRHFKFVDDSFIEPPRDERWCARFADLVGKHGLSIRFRTQVRADRLTAPIVAGLKNAGWFATSVGIENGSSSALKRMAKSATVEQNTEALALLEQHGIYAQMGLILFDPATTMRELEDNFNFLKSHPKVITKGIFTEMFAAEGTPFTKNLKRKGALIAGVGNQNYHYEVRDIRVRRMHQLLKSWHRAHAYIYDWVIDSISAPKILPDNGYQKVHVLCRDLLQLDLAFFRKALDHVKEACEGDEVLLNSEISETTERYHSIRERITETYLIYELEYDGVLNPFLT